MSETLRELVEMSNYLGASTRTYAILGEGNTSARIDSDNFYVKASGTSLSTMKAEDFLPVSISKATAVLEDPGAGDADVERVLREAVLTAGESRKPSVETILHAILLQYPEYNFVGHTHPVAVNALMCSQQAQAAAVGRVCPDHIVVMGHKSVFIPYVDPGLVLAREVRNRIRKFVDEEGVLPKALMLENHGLFAMGATAKTVMNITDMAEKTAQIIIGAASMGGVKYMSAEDVKRIDTRPDEKYRQQLI